MPKEATTGRALGGVAAAVVALGVSQLAAVPFGPGADSRTAVGSAVVDLTPGPVKEWAIQAFGTSDKLMLSIAVLAVIGAVAAATARWETRRRPVGSLAIAAAGLAGAAAVLSRPGSSAIDVVPTVLGTVCGVAVLRLLAGGRLSDGDARVDGAGRVPSTRPGTLPTGPARPGPAPDRGRRLSMVTLGFLAGGLASGVLGTILTRRRASVAGDRDAFALPPASPAPPVPAGVMPPGVTLAPFVTPAADFYRIDTALSVPQLSREQWRLRIHGMVDREIGYTFADLRRFQPVERIVTLTCVSNPVGGDLISTASWTGYRVRDLLADAGIHPDCDMVLSTSVDGFSAGTPVGAFTDQRDALLAVGMNGAPLPTEHGYPARLVVPGLYGYVSATKWVIDLEMTRFDRARAYWTRLGWSERGPIKTESRIDVPRDGASVARGPLTLGGVAWAQGRGIRTIEVRVDPPSGPGEWQRARLGTAYSNDTWRLWSLPWEATERGTHTATVRAVDGTGVMQTGERADVVPDGATGWDEVTFEVT